MTARRSLGVAMTVVVAILTISQLAVSCSSDIGSTSADAAASPVFFNQDLEQVSGAIPVLWERDGYGRNRVAWSLTSAAHSGKVAQTIRITNYRSGDRKLMTSMGGAGLRVQGGGQYELSSWYRLQGAAEIVVFTNTVSEGWQYWWSSDFLAATSSWRLATAITPPLPYDIKGISFGVALSSNGTLVTDDYSYSIVPVATTTTSTTSTSSTTTSAPTTTTLPTTTTTTTLPPSPTMLYDPFTRPDGLITNEYAVFNPADQARVVDKNWEVSSGSLFALTNTAWSGIPDNIDPNAGSTNGNNSAVLRAVTRQGNFANVTVSTRIRRNYLTSTPTTPAVDWDGEHILLRYVTQYSLYYASIDRRDGNVVIKKKVHDGPSNDGVYYDLSPYVSHPMTSGVWHDVQAVVEDRADGTVRITLRIDGEVVVIGTDTGQGGPVIRAGQVGMRGDNSNFQFDDFTVTSS